MEDETMTRIRISRDGIWAGTGRIDSDGCIVDCAAVLGQDQDASDETYKAIEDAIADEPQDAGRYTGTGSMTRPDGIYTWTIDD
jgi:hypothetical protein